MWSVTQDWVTQLNINGSQQQYNIRLVAHKQCCQKLATIQIFVNGTEIQHGLIDNPYSPMCGSTGRYEWQISGHYFLLMANNLTWCTKRYRLFVDAIDVESGLEYSAFWRRRGWIYIMIGAFLMICSGIGIFFFVFYENYSDAVVRPAIVFIVLGLIHFIFGVITVSKYRKPLIYENVGHIQPFSNFPGSAPPPPQYGDILQGEKAPPLQYGAPSQFAAPPPQYGLFQGENAPPPQFGAPPPQYGLFQGGNPPPTQFGAPPSQYGLFQGGNPPPTQFGAPPPQYGVA